MTGVWCGKVRDEVLAAQFGRIDLQLPRRGFHQPFDDKAGFGPARAAIGIDRGGVGVDADHLGEDVGDVVLARQQRRVEIGRHRGGEQRHIGAEIGVGLHPQRGDLVVLVERHLGLGQVIAAMGVGEEGLGAVAGPLHRAPHLLGGPQRHHFLGVDEDLGAEAAADIGRHHPQLVLLRDVVERRQHQAGDMRVLRRRVEREMLLGVVVFGDRRARLHRVRHQPVVGDVERDHVGRRLEGGVGGGFLADGPVVDHVARGFRMQLRRARLDRGADVGRDRQFLIVDDDGFRRVPGLVLGLGDHHRDRLSGEAHDFRRHRRPRAHLHAGAVLGRDRPAADQVADLVVDDLLSGQHPDHAGHVLCRRDVDALDFGMRVRAADEMRVGQAHAA